jgi:uncharacterized protein
MPSEWLRVIWGGGEPEFETEDEMRTVLGTIMGRYNEIAARFNSEFGPTFWEGPEDEVIASDWAGGFLDCHRTVRLFESLPHPANAVG